MRAWCVALAIAVLGCGSDGDDCNPVATYPVTITRTAGQCGEFSGVFGFVVRDVGGKLVLETTGGERFVGTVSRDDTSGFCRTFAQGTATFQTTAGPAALAVTLAIIDGAASGTASLQGSACTASYRVDPVR